MSRLYFWHLGTTEQAVYNVYKYIIMQQSIRSTYKYNLSTFYLNQENISGEYRNIFLYLGYSVSEWHVIWYPIES